MNVADPQACVSRNNLVPDLVNANGRLPLTL